MGVFYVLKQSQYTPDTNGIQGEKATRREANTNRKPNYSQPNANKKSTQRKFKTHTQPRFSAGKVQPLRSSRPESRKGPAWFEEWAVQVCAKGHSG